MFKPVINIVSPLNDEEDTDQLSFFQKIKRLFFANYGTLVPTDLTVWIILSISLWVLITFL